MNENQNRRIDTASESGKKAGTWGTGAALAGTALAAYLTPKIGPEASVAAGALASGALMGLGAWAGSFARNLEQRALGKYLPILAVILITGPAAAQEPRPDVYPSIVSGTYDIAATAPDPISVSMELVRVDLADPLPLGCKEVEVGTRTVWEGVTLEATENHAIVRAVAYPAPDCQGPASEQSENAARIFFRAPNAPEVTDASGGP